MPSEIPNAKPVSGYTLRSRQSRAEKTGFSLRSHTTVDYKSMMLSNAEDTSDAETRKKTTKIRPKPDGPSSMVLRAHAAAV